MNRKSRGSVIQLPLQPSFPTTQSSQEKFNSRLVAQGDKNGKDKNGDRSSLLSSVRPDDAATLSNLTSSLVLKWRVVANAGEKLSLLSQAARTSARAMEVDARSARCNHACLLALSGETDQALEEIRKLIQDDPDKRQQIAEDEDFESVVELPAFRTLLNTR